MMEALTHNQIIKRIAGTDVGFSATNSQLAQPGRYENATIIIDAEGRIVSAISNFSIDLLNLGTSVRTYRPVVTNSHATVTLAADAAEYFVLYTAATPITITLDDTSNAAFPDFSETEGIQGGAGQITFATSGAQVIRAAGGKNKTTAQYSHFWLKKIAPNTWSLYGDLTT